MSMTKSKTNTKDLNKMWNKISNWIYNPYLALHLSPKQLSFLLCQDIVLSTAYPGMVRAYRKGKVVWQTSIGAVVCKAMCQQEITDYKGLELQVKAWINSYLSKVGWESSNYSSPVALELDGIQKHLLSEFEVQK
jgi:hypothetical protein